MRRSVDIGVFLVLLVVAGVVTGALAWFGASSVAVPSREVPYLVSGGFGGIMMIGTGLGLLQVQLRRRAEAAELRHLAGVARAVSEQLAAAR